MVKPVIICALQRSGSTLLFDDIRNILGYDQGHNEDIFSSVSKGLSWEETWRQALSINSMGEYFIENIMGDYVSVINDCILGKPAHQAKNWMVFDTSKCEAFFEFFKNAIWIYLIDKTYAHRPFPCMSLKRHKSGSSAET